MSQKKYKSVISTSQPNRFILLGMFDDLQILTIDGQGVGRISDPVVEDYRNTSAAMTPSLGTAAPFVSGALAGSLTNQGLAAAAKGLGQDVPEVATTPAEIFTSRIAEAVRSTIEQLTKQLCESKPYALVEKDGVAAYELLKKTIPTHVEKISGLLKQLHSYRAAEQEIGWLAATSFEHEIAALKRELGQTK